MHAIRGWLGLLMIIAFSALTWQPAFSQQAQVRSKVGDTEYSVSAFSLYQFDTDLEGGGDYNVQRYFFRFDAGRQMTADIKAGIGLLYDYEDWDFTGATGFRDVPWGDIHRTGIDFSFQYTGIKDWTVFLLPSLQSARESGADWGDSFQIGTVLAALYRLSPKLTLGLGAGLFTGLEDTQVFPFVAIRWQITDRLMLANPFRPGPTGPAGLELIYSIDKTWEIAAGSAWRSFRFQLDDQGIAPEGIGEVNLLPTWVRVSWRLDRRLVLDLYAGVSFDGELKLEDRNGNEIGKVDQDTAPFGALNVNFRF
jgi:Domain of unknown function (DUF6268)